MATRIINPYDGIDFGSITRVNSITHEHIGSSERLQSAYDRGIRHFPSVWYQPSSPVYPYSNSNYTFKDFLYYDTTHPDSSSGTIDVTYPTAKAARASVAFNGVKKKGCIVAYSTDGSTVLYTKLIADEWSTEDEDWINITSEQLGNSLETFDNSFQRTLTSFIDENNVEQSSDILPQIPNSEKVYLRTSSGTANQHINALGVTHAHAGVFERKGLHRDFRLRHYIYALDEMYDIYEESNYSLYGKNFYTINHCNSLIAALNTINDFGDYFNAFELFNQGYSSGWNKEFRNTYDSLLKQGYKLNVASVVDWQGDNASWQYTSASDKLYWTNAYNALSSEEKARYQAEYDAIENPSSYLYGDSVVGYWYYTYKRECKCDRGCNVLLVDNSYNSLPANCFNPSQEYFYSKAEAGLDAYRAGKYYASGRGVHYITSLTVDNNRITISFDASARIKIVTNKYVLETNGSTASMDIQQGVTYVRFEAYFESGKPNDWDEMSAEEQEPYMKQGVMDFIYTNPIWVETDGNGDLKQKMLLLGII